MSSVPSVLSPDIQATYVTDGVVVLRQYIETEWIDALRESVERDIGNPGPFVHSYSYGESNALFHGNLRVWENDLTFRAFCFESCLPPLAAAFFGSTKVGLLFDQLFVKEPGTLARTRWHNDQPYWPVCGHQVMSFWVALDPVTGDNGALEFIRGSHRWGRWFQPEAFGPTLGFDEYEQNPDYEPIPNIDVTRDSYDIVSWDLEPGDMYAFNALTVHGATGNRTEETRRRGYAVRFTGDDAVYDTRSGTNPELCSAVHKKGDLLDSSQYPVVWRLPSHQ